MRRDAMEGKAARACDYCIRKRARWYCAADDAFLCQACDSSVHSANPLARRHARVQLKTLSLNAVATATAASHQNSPNLEPSWHRGFTRKARTPRHGKYNNNSNNSSKPKMTTDVVKTPLHLIVPEMCSDENYSHDENEEQLLYRVPIFDPFLADICTTTTVNSNTITDAAVNESKCTAGHKNWEGKSSSSSMPTEMELAEFAADVESLLGKGLDEESFDMEGLGFLGGDNVVEEKASTMMMMMEFSHEKVVKVEEDAAAAAAADVLMMPNHQSSSLSFDTLELKFDYDDSPNIEEDDEEEEEELSTMDKESGSTMLRKKTILLNLDYEGVLLAWSDQRCPWTTGERPELNSDEGWPECMQRGCGSGTIHAYGVGDMGMTTCGQVAMADGGREARVSRYREKRRTRLFSKKIRYEVRKLNAEKRPRMKGRFVKRANFPAALAYPLLDQQIK